MDFLKYFFRKTSKYCNFKMFGWQHIAILFIGTLGIISMIKRIAVNRKFEKIIGIVLLSQQTNIICMVFTIKIPCVYYQNTMY